MILLDQQTIAVVLAAITTIIAVLGSARTVKRDIKAELSRDIEARFENQDQRIGLNGKLIEFDRETQDRPEPHHRQTSGLTVRSETLHGGESVLA